MIWSRTLNNFTGNLTVVYLNLLFWYFWYICTITVVWIHYRCVFTSGSFTLMCGRGQHNIVGQLSSKKTFFPNILKCLIHLVYTHTLKGMTEDTEWSINSCKQANLKFSFSTYLPLTHLQLSGWLGWWGLKQLLKFLSGSNQYKIVLIVLSYIYSLLRPSDVSLLDLPSWLNDQGLPLSTLSTVTFMTALTTSASSALKSLSSSRTLAIQVLKKFFPWVDIDQSIRC